MMSRETAGRVYDLGDKIGKLLAWLDKKHMANRLVPEIHTASGQVVTDAQEIVDQFALHFQAVYYAKTHYSESEVADFLKDIKLPTLTQVDKNSLKEDLTNEEVAQAIRDLVKRLVLTGSQSNYIN